MNQAFQRKTVLLKVAFPVPTVLFFGNYSLILKERRQKTEERRKKNSFYQNKTICKPS
jgi:hypothetical protein